MSAATVGTYVAIAADTSSQFASSLMLAGATLPAGMTLTLQSLASAPYIDITASILGSASTAYTRPRAPTARASRRTKYPEPAPISATLWPRRSPRARTRRSGRCHRARPGSSSRPSMSSKSRGFPWVPKPPGTPWP